MTNEEEAVLLSAVDRIFQALRCRERANLEEVKADLRTLAALGYEAQAWPRKRLLVVTKAA